jgi:hypothetical protein
MMSFTPVGGNDIYSINLVECRDMKGGQVSSHYEIHDLYRKKCIAICDDLDEARKKIDSYFKPRHFLSLTDEQ